LLLLGALDLRGWLATRANSLPESVAKRSPIVEAPTLPPKSTANAVPEPPRFSRWVGRPIASLAAVWLVLFGVVVALFYLTPSTGLRHDLETTILPAVGLGGIYGLPFVFMGLCLIWSVARIGKTDSLVGAIAVVLLVLLGLLTAGGLATFLVWSAEGRKGLPRTQPNPMHELL